IGRRFETHGLRVGSPWTVAASYPNLVGSHPGLDTATKYNPRRPALTAMSLHKSSVRLESGISVGRKITKTGLPWIVKYRESVNAGRSTSKCARWSLSPG